MADASNPEPSRIDIANLVIAFVGAVAVAATLAGGLAAWFGTTTFNELAERVKKQQVTIDEQVETIKNIREKFEKWQEKAQRRSMKVYITHKYRVFQRAFDALSLDEPHRNEHNFRTIKLIIEELNDKSEFPDALMSLSQKEMIENSNKLFASVSHYYKEEYDKIALLFQGYSGEDANINRVLSLTYSRLYETETNEKGEKIKEYLSAFKRYAQKFYNLAPVGNDRHRHALNHSVGTLLVSGKPEDLEDAERKLERGINLYPRAPSIRLNFASWHILRKEYSQALKRLFEAKDRGGFQTIIRFICEEPEYEPLKKNTDSDIVAQLTKLLEKPVEQACS